MKRKNSNWLPTSRAQQLIMFTNIKAKIAGYVTSLPFPTAKKDRLVLICDTFIALSNYVEQTRATTQQLTEYQDLILTADGGTQGDPAPPVPEFKALTLPADAFVGIFEEFRKLVEDIKAADNYTRGIGEDLMIVAPEGADLIEDEIVAAMKIQTFAGYKVRVESSLQGMDAMRVEYQKRGASDWQIAGFLTKLPGEVTIAPTVPGNPESGEMRCVLISKNEPVGQFSPNYPVTVSQ